MEKLREEASSNDTICRDFSFGFDNYNQTILEGVEGYDGAEITSHPGYAGTMFLPMLLFLTLSFPQFLKIEKQNWKRTLPIFLLFCWPQYRAARVIFYGLFKKSPKWQKEKNPIS